MPAATETLAEIRSFFEEAAVPENAGPMQAYMKDIAPFMGLKAPERKAIEKEIFRHYSSLAYAEWEHLLRQLFKEPERELHYLAMDWLYHRRKDYCPETISLIEHLLTTKSWWDTVDFLAARCLGEWGAKFPETAAPVLTRYVQSDNFWLCRSAILHQLYYKKKTDTQLLAVSIVPHFSQKEFFIRKAIGWALRQYGRTNPDWVRDFVETYPGMSALSRREAMKTL